MHTIFLRPDLCHQYVGLCLIKLIKLETLAKSLAKHAQIMYRIYFEIIFSNIIMSLF